MAEAKRKTFPANYSDDTASILRAMAFGPNLKVLGSMGIRSQQYAGDFDGYEVVELKGRTLPVALAAAKRKFQSIVGDLKKKENTFVGDIKAGAIPEWRVIPLSAYLDDGVIRNFDVDKAEEKVDELEEAKIITAEEAKETRALLKKPITPSKFLEAKNNIKFHIVRWTPAEIARGSKRLRDGRTFSLEEAFTSPGITKLDVISWVEGNRFTDFSVIYQFRYKGKVLNEEPIQVKKSLKENIVGLQLEGDLFKSLKRMFALAKLEGNKELLAELTPVLNSDLGRLYHIIGDLRTLKTLLEEHDPEAEEVRFEIDQFKRRLSNIYTLKDYLRKEPAILQVIHKALNTPLQRLPPILDSLAETLNRILQRATAHATDAPVDFS
jgi:hypothetical protein